MSDVKDPQQPREDDEETGAPLPQESNASAQTPQPDDMATGTSPGSDQPTAPDSWELWAQITLLMATLAALGWLMVYLRLGQLSIYIHAFVLSTLGFLTLPIMFWGLIKAMFNRPVLRRSRTIAFFLLIAIAFFCNIPHIAVPLSTEDWRSTHTYRLPFEGEWLTIAGGDSKSTNYHATTATYRWGYDFSPLVDGKLYQGDGASLNDYACFGEPVFSPVAGEVFEVEKQLEDNTPGEVPDEHVLGNHVVLRVGPQEFLYIAHMKKGSIPLKAGMKVAAGDKIGECGNSGRSPMPHIHVHLQNSADFPVAESLPLRFSNYRANGELIELGMPRGTSNIEPWLP